MGVTSKLGRAARKMVMAACGSFTSPPLVEPTISGASLASPSGMKGKDISRQEDEDQEKFDCSTSKAKNLCAICLEALSYSTGSSPGQAIFTAQCSHSFHFSCISSNVRHGNVTCPICRAVWTQLPRNIYPLPCALSCNQSDPVFRILDDSIATFRVHRRSFLRSARYDDDDPVDPDHSHNHPCLDFSLKPIPASLLSYPCSLRHRNLGARSLLLMEAGMDSDRSRYLNQLSSPASSSSSSSSLSPLRADGQEASCLRTASQSGAAYLFVKLTNPRATDLVLVASPNGPHLRLLKQSMALVVFALRAIDRLAIVTYSSAAARVFPLRRMTSCGKRSALQVIDRLFYTGYADPIEGLRKGIKVLEDRAHKNPQSCILHLSDTPTRPYHAINMQLHVPVHRFHLGFGFGASNGLVMREFEEFLSKLLGGLAKEVQLRIGEEDKIVRLGELRAGEEKKILLELGEYHHVSVGYSYVEEGIDECIRTGETVIEIGEKTERKSDGCAAVSGGDAGGIVGGRSSSVETWDYHDPFMARRWAKRLHGYRL